MTDEFFHSQDLTVRIRVKQQQKSIYKHHNHLSENRNKEPEVPESPEVTVKIRTLANSDNHTVALVSNMEHIGFELASYIDFMSSNRVK